MGGKPLRIKITELTGCYVNKPEHEATTGG